MNSHSTFSNDRPSFRELLDFAEGRLSGTDEKRVAEFLRETPHEVAEDWSWIQDFLAKSGSVDLHAVPRELEERLVRLYPAETRLSLAESAAQVVGSIRRVVAELLDPGPSTDFASAGLRSTSFEKEAQQWVFKTGHFEICVNALVRPDRKIDLHGQVFTDPAESGLSTGSVQLVREELECGLSTVDAYGEFLVSGVPAGSYSLVLASGEREIVCEPLIVKG